MLLIVNQDRDMESIGTEAWRDGEGVSGPPVGLGVLGGTTLPKKSWALEGGVVQEE